MGLGVGAAIIGGAMLNTGSQMLSNQRTNLANMQLARYSYSKDLEMWNRSNEYNTPGNQMARLEQAGLNPNMVYGSGSVTGNTVQPSMPKFNAPTVDYKVRVDPLNTLSTYADLAIKTKQADLITAQTRQVEENTFGLQLMNALKSENKNYLSDEMQYKSLKTGEEWKKSIGDVEIKNQLIDQNKVKLSQMEEDLKFKQYENILRSQGINSTDDPRFRIAVKILDQMGMSPFAK